MSTPSADTPPSATEVLAFFNKVGVRPLLNEAVLAAALEFDHLSTYESLLDSLWEVWKVIKRVAEARLLAQRRTAKDLEAGGAGGGSNDRNINMNMNRNRSLLRQLHSTATEWV